MDFYQKERAVTRKKKNGAAELVDRTAPIVLRYPTMSNYRARVTVTGTGRQIVLQTGEWFFAKASK